ncbi:MAG: ATP-binding cassette domain-containing protein [Proteobacteria bacterium]|nr:ATP-binding cassette domain-containing protein [Pseudomonadota bacterium]
MSALLEIDGLEQRLRDAERPEEFVVRVPQRLSIAAGDFVAILGPSGCGKTTLLSVLGLLRAPTNAAGLNAFRMCVRDGAKSESVDLAHLWKRRAHSAIERVRRRCIGFALQSGELLPALTVRENIEAPLCLNGWPATKRKSRVDYLISAFQLRRQTAERDRPLRNGSSSTYDLAMARVNKLSGGEYQRVSLARAIAHQR